MRVPRNVAAELERFRKAGYDIEARIVAVNPNVSEQGVLRRYVDQVMKGGSGRIVGSDYHNIAVAGLKDSADKLQDDRLVHRVILYRRGNAEIDRFDLTKPLEPSEPRIRAAIEAEHQRPLTDQEATTFYATAKNLNAYAANNPSLNPDVKMRIANNLKVAEVAEAAREQSPCDGVCPS